MNLTKEQKEKIGINAHNKPISIKHRPTRPEDQNALNSITHATAMANAMSQCLWLGDKDHKTIYVNEVYEHLTEYSLKECIGKPADFCFDEKSKAAVIEHHKLRAQGKASQYEAMIITKSGKKIPILISGAPTTTGGSLGIFTNLTELKKLNQQKRISEQIIRNTTEALITLDKNRNVKMWNNGAEKMFGYKEKEVLNKKIKDLLIPKEQENDFREIIDKVEKHIVHKNHETKRRTKCGKILDVSISVSKVVGERNKFIGYLIVYRDITNNKKINSELQKRFEAIQDAYKELGLQKRQHDYLYEISDLAVSKSSFQSLARLILSAICMLTKCDAAILRTNENNKYLKLKASLGVNENWEAKNKINIENSLAQEAFQNKRPIIIQDATSCDKHQGIKLVKSHDLTTLIVIPLFIEDELIGSLSLYTTDPAKFRLIETEFLQTFGKQCSMALRIKSGK